MKSRLIHTMLLLAQVGFALSVAGNEAISSTVFERDYPDFGEILVVERKRASLKKDDASQREYGGLEMVFFWEGNGDKPRQIHSEFISIDSRSIQQNKEAPLPWASEDPEREARSIAILQKEIESKTLNKPTVLDAELVDGKLYVVYWNSLWTSVISYSTAGGNTLDTKVNKLVRDSFADAKFVQSATLNPIKQDVGGSITVTIRFSDGSIKVIDMSKATNPEG